MKTRDFKRVHSRRQEFRDGRLLLKVGAPKSTASRLGVVVSKKVEKLAVRRNRIRRVLKEVMRAEMGRMGGGQDIVLIALPGLEAPSFLCQDRHRQALRLPRPRRN